MAQLSKLSSTSVYFSFHWAIVEGQCSSVKHQPKAWFSAVLKLKMASESFSWSIQRKDMLYWAVQSKLLRIKPDENTLQFLFDNEIAVIMNSKRLLHWASHLLCLWNVLVYLCSYSNAGLENQASCGLCTLLVQTCLLYTSDAADD